jgi:replicative DNA helicase
MLYSNQDAMNLLGCLLKKPEILIDDRYKLTKEDFKPRAFDLTLFAVIYNLAIKGAKEINPIDVGTFCEPYKAQMKILEDNDYVEFINTIKGCIEEENFELYYYRVKKFSLLREYKKIGFDISDLYDESQSENEQKTKLDTEDLKDILEYFEAKQAKIKKEFYADENIEESLMGKGFMEVKNQYKKDPAWGASTFSELVNTCCRGWQEGQFQVFSMASGTGKTLIGLVTLINVCCSERYNKEKKCYEKNPCYQGSMGNGLYIQYELSNAEINARAVSIVSKVDTSHILNGNYLDGEEDRVNYAINLLEKSNIHLILMPNFTLGLLTTYIKDYVLSYNIKFVVVDYISNNSELSQEFFKANSGAIREDMVLSTFSKTLKGIARSLNIAILSFTQMVVNNTIENLDANCISGSRAIQNALDVGGVCIRPRPKDNEIIEGMMGSLQNKKFGDLRPNRIMSLYKIRFGEVPQGIMIYFNINMNNGEVIDMFCTDSEGNPINIDKTELKGK